MWFRIQHEKLIENKLKKLYPRTISSNPKILPSWEKVYIHVCTH